MNEMYNIKIQDDLDCSYYIYFITTVDHRYLYVGYIPYIPYRSRVFGILYELIANTFDAYCNYRTRQLITLDNLCMEVDV